MITLEIALPNTTYPILIGSQILADCGQALWSAGLNTGQTAVVADENVWRLHGEALTSLLDSLDMVYAIHIIPPGENSKSLLNLEALYHAFTKMGLHRNDSVIAFGGGVVGDLAGLAAATYMRGVPLIQIPTTLLAQVDSSVGGKVAVNLPEGKNLVGSFFQPRLVIADTWLLSTLPDREWKSGLAEVIKYAAIGAPELLTLLDNRTINEWAEVVSLSCQCKAHYVMEDELDQNQRMMLNFGHTFGHAIEKHYQYQRYNHGEAVGMGMVLAAATGERLGVTEPGTSEKLSTLLHKLGIDPAFPGRLIDLMLHMQGDKKNSRASITLVLLHRLGQPFTYAVAQDDLESLFMKGIQDG